MNRHVILGALVLSAALAGCGNKSAPSAGLLLNEPSTVAVFHGRTQKDAKVRPYLAIANAGANDLAILDARDDSLIQAPTPVPTRTVVFPVAGRPTLLAAVSLHDPEDVTSDTEDDKADLLVVVSAGDSALQVIRTWEPDGAVVGKVDLEADILALVAVPSDPGTARIAAALAGERIRLITFRRAADGVAIDVPPAPEPVSGPLGFQPIALAAMPGNTTRIWAATRDDLGGGVHGVAAIDVPVGGTPVFAGSLDALAPTRLVTALSLRERGVAATSADPDSWSTTTVNRVYAVLDESGCGETRPINCGLVALDADGAGIVPDFVGTAPRAPIFVPGRALAVAAAGGPAAPPSSDPADAIYQSPWIRFFLASGARRTSGAAVVASSDGALYFVDLGRWEIPSDQALQQPGAAVTTPDPQVVVTSLSGTAGFTPTARWTLTNQGELPGLASRRVQAVDNTRFAFQVPAAPGAFADVVVVAQAGIEVDDIVDIFDPSPLSTSCAPSFAARVSALQLPDPTNFPGGALDVTAPAQCIIGLRDKENLRATVRAKEWILVRGTGSAAVQVSRPVFGANTVTSRRISYAPEIPPGDPVGPALAFTFDPATGVTTVRSGASVAIDTTEGRTRFRGVDPSAAATDPRSVVPFDRSLHTQAAGVRFFVPYASGVVLDASPTLPGGNVNAMR